MPEFFKRIKTRIALSFSLLFLVVAIPAIIYAFRQGNLFFEGMYLRQMRVAAQTARALYASGASVSADSLTSSLSEITASSVFLISGDGRVLSLALEDHETDTLMLSLPIPPGQARAISDGIGHQFARIDGRRYLKVEAGLAGGIRLLQVKSFSRVTELMVRMREVIAWSSFLGLIALIAVAFWVSAKITGPLEELTRWVQQIRDGRLAEKTSIESPDEVGDLADALNDIVDYLNLAGLRLSRLESMRGDFFAIIRTELESSVKALQGRIEKLLIMPPDDPSTRERIEAAGIEMSNLRRVVDELLTLSEIESGQRSLDKKAFPLVDVIDEITAKTGTTSSNAPRLENECPDATGKTAISADKKLLRIALENLIIEAAGASPGATIKIGCHRERDGLKISIDGSGLAHPPDFLAGSETTPGPELKAEQERSRLGQAIAMHIIEAHGQRLFVERASGKGIRYSFWLPLASPDPQ